MKLGIDIHGVANEPALTKMLRDLTKILVDSGNEVHILSGPPKEIIEREVRELGLSFTHLFSIVDFHLAAGTPMTRDGKGHYFCDDYLWDKTKGDYCKEHGISLHFDDSDRYSYFFTTPYARVFTKDKRTSIGRSSAKKEV